MLKKAEGYAAKNGRIFATLKEAIIENLHCDGILVTKRIAKNHNLDPFRTANYMGATLALISFDPLEIEALCQSYLRDIADTPPIPKKEDTAND